MAIPSSDDDSFAKSCWFKFRQEAVLYSLSPVAVCLASGSLDSDTFRHFVAQDVHILNAFAQACEKAEHCADDDDDDDAKLALSEFRKVVSEELAIHVSFVQEWGSNESPINSATEKYTKFLLGTASGKIDGLKAAGNLCTPFGKTKIPAYTLGAMAPRMVMYYLLAIQCNAFLKNDQPYKKWIEKYSLRFLESAVKTEASLDKLSVSFTGDELNIIEKLYHQAVKLLLEFFYAQPVTQPTAAPLTKEHDPVKDHLVIFCDFDLTCTDNDSAAYLAQITMLRALKSDQNQQEGQTPRMSFSELRNKWEEIGKQYTDEYGKCISSMLASVKVELNYEALHKALEQISEFEKKANSRVIESGALKGINLKDIKKVGEKLIFRDGCINFFQKIAKSENLNASIHIISYCWSGDLIRAAFSSRGLDVDVLDIHTNELSFEESECTGEFVGNVQSPIEKVQIFNDILQRCSNDKKKLTVYIGDTVGDLLCLVRADIGIVIGSSSSLRDLASQYGVSFVPLFPGLVMKQKEYAEGSTCIWKSQSGILYTVSCWDEIHTFFFGR